MSPFDPFAMLDEIQRLVPGYEFSRLNLLAGSDEHVTAPEHSSPGQPGLVQIVPAPIVPANDTLFTSGTLGRYSHALHSILENRRTNPADKEVMESS